MVAVSGERLLIQRDQDVHRVERRSDLMLGNAHAVVGMLAHDVGVVFDVRVHVKTGAAAGLGEDFGRGVDAAALRAADHPGEVVLQGSSGS